ncbi:hypothetical protein ACTQ49_12830 [Luteococcus sp. Sow4_B9]|uniref:hypothetical protein n=1 Tax=Luteococcus sp. Sow4_B9 TaxID=3438792 RepID=UPI003F9C9F0B
MPRRVSLPGASELFRPTSAPDLDLGPGTTDPMAVPNEQPTVPQSPPARTRKAAARKTAARQTVADQAAVEPARPSGVVEDASGDRPSASANRSTGRKQGPRAASGRVRHDEKITVYVSRDELMALEHARLELRGDHDLAVDRGRIVRESIALAMADLAAHGAESALVRRLNED